MKEGTASAGNTFSIRRVANALLVVLVGTTAVAAFPLLAGLMPWRLIVSSNPVSLGHGATFVTKKVKRDIEAELHLVFFNTRSCELRVIEQPLKTEAKPLEEIARANGAIAACNGGYFDVPNFLTSGLQIVAGKKQGKLVRDPLWGCVLVRSGITELLPMEEFHDEAGVSDFVQCSPMYVLGSRALKLGDRPRNTRTFALTDQAGHWAIGTCRNVGLQEMADILATPGVIREFTVKRALNLDGGPSTGLWWKDVEGVGHYDKEKWRVKNMLLILPKK